MMAFEYSDEELLSLLQELLRRRNARYRVERVYSIPWDLNESLRARLVSSEKGSKVERFGEEEDVEDRVSTLEKEVNKIVADVDEIKTQLRMKTSLKEETLRQFKEMISEIPEVKEAYYLETTDGFDFWTLFESSNRIGTLQKIVQVQVELDRTYKDVYFDFLVNHISDVDRSEFGNWKLIYKKA